MVFTASNCFSSVEKSVSPAIIALFSLFFTSFSVLTKKHYFHSTAHSIWKTWKILVQKGGKLVLLFSLTLKDLTPGGVANDLRELTEMESKIITETCICCGAILFLVQILFSFF